VAALRRAPAFGGRRIATVGLALAGAGFLLCALGLVVDPARTWRAYLTAVSTAVSIAVGALVLQMAGYAAGSRWLSVTRRLTETISASFPILAALFAPVLFGADLLYPWMGAPAGLAPPEQEILRHRAGFMNLPGFAARAALYFAVWIAAAELLRRWSRARDRAAQGEDARRPDRDDAGPALGRERALSSALLPLVGLAITFAAFDWIMSLHAVWYSTIFGVYVFAGGFASAIGLVIVLAERARAAHRLDWALTPNHFHALGRLLFAFTVFWAYCAFFQAMLIQIANRPEEVTFYIDRIAGPWRAVAALLVVGHFALPFLLLLPRAIKFRPRAMAAAGGWLVAMHLVDVGWLILPSGGRGEPPLHWVDAAALAAVLGSAAAFSAWRARGAPLVAARDPLFEAGTAYRSPL
jgi:hypothetical protein